MVRTPPPSPVTEALRPRLSAARRTAVMLGAAGHLRRRDLTEVDLAELARESGAPETVLIEEFGTADGMIRAILSEALQRLKAGDQPHWAGYGAGMRRSLSAARSFEDGFLLLARNARQKGPYQSFHEGLRKRTGQRLRGLLWYPDRPPPPPERPPLLDLAVEPMITYCNDALAYWVERGDRARDGIFIRWWGQTMQAWRSNACELLNLDSPDQDWPFEADPL